MLARIHSDRSKVGIYVIPTNEELTIAKDTEQLINLLVNGTAKDDLDYTEILSQPLRE